MSAVANPRVTDPGGVVWRSLPGSQSLAVSCPCHQILYHGSRGPGKTDAQLMAFRRNVGKGYGSFWRGVIFDREYKNLDDLVSKAYRWFPKFGDGAKFLSSNSDYKWVWPSGEALLFRRMSRTADYYAYHGHEYPFIGWNELTKYPKPELYDMMMSCNRTSFDPAEHSPDPDNPLPEIPLTVFSTTNPHGVGHNWVKNRFITPAPPGKVVVREVDVFNPRTNRREKVRKTQVHIFGSYIENRYLTPEYVAELESITEPNKRRAWLGGDWDIVAGGALDDLWEPTVHVIAPFDVPANWRIDRSFDWGSSHPFSVGWWAEANGEEVTLDDGTLFCPQPGSLVRVAELYGTEAPGTNIGTKASATTIAEEVLAKERKLLESGRFKTTPRPGPADNQIRDVKESDVDSIEKKMADAGVRWTRSDKSKGSRVVGLELVRERLEASVKGEGPGLYFTNECRAVISTLPVLPRDEDNPDDVDTESEDHAYDEVRYRVLAADNRGATEIPTDFVL